jgi:hypothetical protein
VVTFTASLSFPDGQTISGKVSAETPYDHPAVIYSGPVDRLPRRFEKASPPLLKVLFRNLARETGARFSERARGIYAAQSCHCLK